MSRFQEALNFLHWHCEVTHQEQQDILQELIDKETPMKPVIIFGTECCTKCKHCLEVNHVRFTRCNNVDCGQVVDWNDED